MEKGMKTNVIAVLALCAFAGFSASALAGQKLKSDVIINTPDGISVNARGSIGTARNSLDGNQRIGCELKANTTSSTLSGSCDATSAAGAQAFCITNSPQLIEVIKSIGTDSYISFTYVPSTSGNPTCSAIIVSNSSVYEPKKP